MESTILNEVSTPFYLFDGDKLKERINYLRNALPKDIGLCFAIKANTIITGEAEPLVDRLEICSPGEANVCTSLGVPEEKMVISGVYKTPEVIQGLMKDHKNIGIYTVESLQHFDLIRETAQKENMSVNVLLRLTSGNQFGMDVTEVKALIKEYADDQYVKIKGIQFFSGTQKYAVKKIRREIEKLDALITAIRDELGFECEELEYGTGFPVAYFEGEEFDEDTYLKEFSEIITSMVNKPVINLEIGRSIVASCGTYFTKVVDTKVNKKVNYAIMDGGIHQIHYFGQMMAMNMPHMHLIQQEPDDSAPEEVWNVCGSLCTVNDILVKSLTAKNLRKGDILAFENAGAYCVSEGIALFLTRDIPAVVYAADGKYKYLRKSVETYNINKPITK